MLMQTETAGKTSTLGTIAEYSSHAQNGIENPAYARRFRLLRAARSLLPSERIADCQHAIAPNSKVQVVVSPDRAGASFQNLVCCESMSCPFCAVAASERNRHELSVALAQAKDMDLYPFMVTMTLSHRAGDALVGLLDALKTAYDRVFSGRWYQELKDEWGIVCKIRTTEVTVGKNGWHPHLHILFFAGRKYDDGYLEALRQNIGKRWRGWLKRAGASANMAHGVDVTNAESSIADYISKWGHEPINGAWGVDHEIAKANTKKAQNGGLTPFALLDAASGNSEALDAAFRLIGGNRATLQARCGFLYTEYFYAFKGRSRIHWGNARKVLDLEAALWVYEQQNPVEQHETYVMAQCFDNLAWHWLRGKFDGKDRRAEFLTVCATRDAYAVKQWIIDNRARGIKIPASAFYFSNLVRDKSLSQIPKCSN